MKCCVAGLALILSHAASAQAADFNPARMGAADTRLTAQAFVGYLNAKSGEFSFDGAEKISQLDWSIDNALIAGASLSFQANEWLALRAGGWTTIASASTMDDFDWFDGFNGFDSWTHWSHHPDTDTTRALELDLSAAADVGSLGGATFGVLAGYRFRTMKWLASNGTYIYSSETGFRDETGTLAGPLVRYEQNWHTPYLGLGVSATAGAFRLRGEVIGSPFVFARARDHHIARDLVFTENYRSAGMVGVSVAAERDFGSDWTLFGKADFQNYFLTRGNVRVQDIRTGETLEFQDGAGASHHSLVFTLGLSRRF